jgi:hypothetical protein
MKTEGDQFIRGFYNLCYPFTEWLPGFKGINSGKEAYDAE